MFSKTLIVNYVVFLVQFWQTMSSYLDILRMYFYVFRNVYLIFSSSTTHPHARYINDKHMNLHFWASMEHLKLSKRNRFCSLKEGALFLFVLGIISRICKTKNILFLGMYRYTFSFALKLITALLQKLAIFYI